MFSVEGRVALVTGGGSGLGHVCAEALVRGGARVFIASRKVETCLEAARRLSEFGVCEALEADLSVEEGIQRLAAAVAARTDRLDILVNNAGVTWGASYEQFPWKGWTRVLDVNVAALFSLTRDLTTLLAAAASPSAPARVVNLGSVTGTLPMADRAYSYAVSKAAVHHLTRILARELASRHITVNAIAPGPFVSKMTRFALQTEEGRRFVAGRVPLGRLGEPDDLAGTLLYLCGRAGAYMSGAILPLDGGMTTHAVDLWPEAGA